MAIHLSEKIFNELYKLKERERERTNHHSAPIETEKASSAEEHRGWGNVSGKPWQFQNQQWKHRHLSLKRKQIKESLILFILFPKLLFSLLLLLYIHIFFFLCILLCVLLPWQ